jgi:hypothetical protein
MKRRRKTEAERRQERADAEAGIWLVFSAKLRNVRSFVDAKILVSEGPPPAAPGQRFYSNLAFFLHSFVVPNGSNRVERGLYLQLIHRLDEAGELKQGQGDRREIEGHFGAPSRHRYIDSRHRQR